MGPGWAQASMAPSRLFKGFVAEGGIRVPLVVKLPGKMANAGTMNHSFVHVRDVMPTILDLAGVEFAQEIDGRSVVPMQGGSVLDLFSGETDVPYEGASQVGYELFGMKSFFDGDWKILWMPPPFGSGEWELYNVKEDPGELTVLNSQFYERLERMIAEWERYKEDNGVLDVSFEIPVGD